jgi:hypothetical protein
MARLADADITILRAVKRCDFYRRRYVEQLAVNADLRRLLADLERPMTDHVAYIHTRTPGPVKVAVCSCGWESNPRATAIAAIKERDEHIRRPPADAGDGRGRGMSEPLDDNTRVRSVYATLYHGGPRGMCVQVTLVDRAAGAVTFDDYLARTASTGMPVEDFRAWLREVGENLERLMPALDDRAPKESDDAD